jgi:hypothetical protein
MAFRVRANRAYADSESVAAHRELDNAFAPLTSAVFTSALGAPIASSESPRGGSVFADAHTVNHPGAPPRAVPVGPAPYPDANLERILVQARFGR